MKDAVILIVDDDPAIRFAFTRTFESLRARVIEAGTGQEALHVVADAEPDVIFMDVSMPNMSGLEALSLLNRSTPTTPVIIITGQGNMQTAIQAMQNGAYDYLTKPLDVDEVRLTCARALEHSRMSNRLDELERGIGQGRHPGRQIIGGHASIQRVFKSIGMISTTPPTTNVMILGETGTGKELVARAIHEAGPRPDTPFQAINCAAMPENLMESELFGHEKGSFTGADRRKIGKFEIAGVGTVFLDEIGDLPLPMQMKLLRVIQERSFERIGGHESIDLKARIIVATNRDLKSAAARGDFREDLYYRLAVMEVELPPLRERAADIPVLVDHFVARFNELFGKKITRVADDVAAALSRHRFPGNVRELENMIERAVVLERGNVLTATSFPHQIIAGTPQPNLEVPVPEGDFAEAKQAVVDAFETKYLRKLIARHVGNVSRAAREAGMERQSLHRLLSKHGIEPDTFRPTKPELESP